MREGMNPSAWTKISYGVIDGHYTRFRGKTIWGSHILLTRMEDENADKFVSFYDIYILSRTYEFYYPELHDAVVQTFDNGFCRLL